MIYKIFWYKYIVYDIIITAILCYDLYLLYKVYMLKLHILC